jgi:hypothetical protein
MEAHDVQEDDQPLVPDCGVVERHPSCDLEAARPSRSSSHAEPFSPLTPHRFRASLPPEGNDVGQDC